MLAYVDEMTKAVQVSEKTVARLKSVLASDREVVEVTVLCGGYNLVSRFLEATKVTPEAKAGGHTLPTMPVAQS